MDLGLIKHKIDSGEFIYICKGSARKVYDIGNGTVLKLAYNHKGIGQNEVEAHMSGIDDILAEVLYHSLDYKFIIMEKGIRPKSIQRVRQALLPKIEGEYPSKYWERWWSYLQDIAKSIGITPGDLDKVSSWALVGDEYKIVDYGLTTEVFKLYYAG